MGLNRITEKEFLDAIENKNVISTKNSTYDAICNFYSVYSQDDFFDVVTDNATLFIDSTDVSVYKAFGIQFNAQNVNMSTRRYLMLIPQSKLESVEELEAFVKEETAKHPDYNYTDFGITGVINPKTAEQLVLNFNSVLPNKRILNEDLKLSKTSAKQVRKLTNVTYKNIFDYFVGENMWSQSLNTRIKTVYKVLDKIIADKDKHMILYCEDVPDKKFIIDSPEFHTLIPAMAAYLSIKYHMLFELSDGLNILFEMFASELVMRQYNYVEEYFKFVIDPIDCGYQITDGNGYIMIKDIVVMNQNPNAYRPKARILMTDYDIDSASVLENGVDILDTYVDTFDVISVRELFNLSSANHDDALKGMQDLNVVFSSFEQYLTTESKPLAEPADVTNTFFFRYDDKVKIAYVDRITGEYQYAVRPYDSDLQTFKVKVPVQRLPEILDLRLLEDCNRIESFVLKKRWVSGRHNHYDLPSYAHGLLLVGVIASAEILDETISIEEAGIWLKTTAEVRLKTKYRLLEEFNLAASRVNGLITCYGGPHASYNVRIEIRPDCWR